MNFHETLTKTNAMAVVATAGAGVHLIDQLWRTPGSSNYLAGAYLLHARDQIDRFLGFQPKGYCSPETSIDLAISSYLAALRAPCKSKIPVAIAVTAAVASDRLPKGDQRAHIAIITPNGLHRTSAVFEKATGENARYTQDRAISLTVFKLLKTALTEKPVFDCEAYDRLKARPLFLPDGRRKAGMPRRGSYFPANFHPVHDGHLEACTKAEQAIGNKVHYMIEVCPPNKPAIPFPDLLARIAALQPQDPEAADRGRAVAVTLGEPTYVDKARARPRSSFIAGADAVQRMLQPGWGYDVSYMLEELDALQTRFFVLGRKVGERFLTVRDLDIPPAYRHLFHHLEGRIDVSSTEIRETCPAF